MSFFSGNVSVTSTASAALTALSSESETLLNKAKTYQALMNQLQDNDPQKTAYQKMVQDLIESANRMSSVVINTASTK